MGNARKMARVFLICGVSGSGKSWACRQVADRFNYIPHDRCWTHPTASPDGGLDPTWKPGAISHHPEIIIESAFGSSKPILTECPFAERALREQLETAGCEVVPYFVIEHPIVVKERYEKREGKTLPKNVWTRATSIRDRALEWRAPHGTSAEILELLKKVPL